MNKYIVYLSFIIETDDVIKAEGIASELASKLEQPAVEITVRGTSA